MHRPIGRPAALLATLGALLLGGCGDNDPAGPENVSALERLAAPADDQPDLSTADPAAPLATTASRLPRSFFINPTTGSDANAGTSLKPFKTLAKGLSAAISGDTMRLAAGIYSAATNGEKFTTLSRSVTVPAGVKIFGTNFGDVTARLVGTSADQIGLDLKGDATIRDVQIAGFANGVRAIQGTQTLKHLELDQNLHGLVLAGTAHTTLVGSFVTVPTLTTNSTNGAQLSQQAQLVMDAGLIGTNAPACTFGTEGIHLGGAARLTMKNGADIEEVLGPGITALGTSKVTLSSGTSITRNLFSLTGCRPGPGIEMSDSSTVTLVKARVTTEGGTGSVGIRSRGKGLLTLDSAVVEHHTGAGVSLTEGLGRLTAKGTRFQGNAVGIDASPLAAAEVTVTTSTLTKNTVAIRTPYLRLRSSTVSGNVTGVLITRSARFSDLGQPGLPGNNILGGNTQTGVKFDTAVINSGFGAVFATGNTWTPFTQQADGGGHYPSQPLVTGDSPNARGTNFEMPSGAGLFEIQL